jgi:hypothetical protein
MAWDFSTDPEFQTRARLDARVRPRRDRASQPAVARFAPLPAGAWLRKIVDPLKREVKSRGCGHATWVPSWAAAAGQVKLR